MKRNTSASNQGSLHESLPDKKNKKLLDSSYSSCSSGSHYVKSCKEIIMARNCVAKAGKNCFLF